MVADNDQNKYQKFSYDNDTEKYCDWIVINCPPRIFCDFNLYNTQQEIFSLKYLSKLINIIYSTLQLFVQLLHNTLPNKWHLPNENKTSQCTWIMFYY